jgi:hypothetical protein
LLLLSIRGLLLLLLLSIGGLLLLLHRLLLLSVGGLCAVARSSCLRVVLRAVARSGRLRRVRWRIIVTLLSSRLSGGLLLWLLLLLLLLLSIRRPRIHRLQFKSRLYATGC